MSSYAKQFYKEFFFFFENILIEVPICRRRLPTIPRDKFVKMMKNNIIAIAETTIFLVKIKF